ncbi:hypothetical protein GCM10020220_096650 [Nonomuraea rubra]
MDVDTVDARIAGMRESGTVKLYGTREIPFVVGEHLVFERKISLPEHPNGMRFTAYADSGERLREKVYFSVGGGFVVDEKATGADRIKPDDTVLPFPFTTGEELLKHCSNTGLSISALMLENERAFGRTEEEIRRGLLHLWQVMSECVRRGISKEGVLPGGLKVKRRANQLYRRLQSESPEKDPLQAMDWVTLFALAVNEENAAGGRIVHRAHQRRRRHHPGRPDLLHPLRPARRRRRRGPLPADGGRDRRAVQGERLDLGRRGGLPGRGGLGLLDGLRRAHGGARGHARAGGERRRDRHRAQPGADLRPDRRPRPDPVHRAQRRGLQQGHHGGPHRAARRRQALRGAGQGHQDDARHGRDMLDKYKETSRGGLAVNVIEC